MKHLVRNITSVFFSLLIINEAGLPQDLNQWSDPIMIDDSIWESKNVTSSSCYCDNVLLIWESKIDCTSTSLHFKYLPDDTTAHLLVYESSWSQFKNPTACSIYSNQTFKHLVVFENETAGEPILNYVIIDGYNISDIKVVYEDSLGEMKNPFVVSNKLVWESSGKIMYSEYSVDADTFSTPEIAVDSLASSPKLFSNDYLVWIHEDTVDGDDIYMKSGYYSFGYHWHNNETIISNGGINSQLNVSTTYSSDYAFPVWKRVFNDTSRITFYDYWGIYQYTETINDIINISEPAGYFSDIIGRNQDFIPFMIAYIQEDSVGMKNIYAGNSGYGSWGGTVENVINNVSQTSNEVRNPYITSPYNYDSFNMQFVVWCIWEEKINNIWHLMGSWLIDELEMAVDDENPFPQDFKLYQNHPNPFNPITTIRYELSQRSNVQITIYDLLGRKVTSLVNQTQEAGLKSVTWNATNYRGKPVSAGVYLYQIQAGDFVQTKKMVVLK